MIYLTLSFILLLKRHPSFTSYRNLIAFFKMCDTQNVTKEIIKSIIESSCISALWLENKRKISHLHQRLCGLRRNTTCSASNRYECGMTNNNSLNIWILKDPKIWGTYLNRREVVMSREKERFSLFSLIIVEISRIRTKVFQWIESSQFYSP